MVLEIEMAQNPAALRLEKMRRPSGTAMLGQLMFRQID
jgi:hypothetical protein